MSSYKRKTKHPVTGTWEMADWLDDYFGQRHYGVRFADGSVFDPEKIKLETDYDSQETKQEGERLGDFSAC